MKSRDCKSKQSTSAPRSNTLPETRPFTNTTTQAETEISPKVEPGATFEFSKIAITANSTANIPQPLSTQMPLQAKLTIGEPGDKHEQEADRVASQVVQQINSPQSAQREEDTRRAGTLSRMPLQRQSSIPVGPASNEFEGSLNRAHSGGHSMEPKLQSQMESAMGADFSRVKVHTDAQADQLSQSIQAKAFTTGPDIFFKQGEYNPSSRSGQELIAHELTHTVQQGAALQREPETVVQRQLVSSNDPSKRVTIKQAHKFVCNRLHATTKEDQNFIMGLVRAYNRKSGPFTPSDLVRIAIEEGFQKKTPKGTDDSSKDTASKDTASDNVVTQEPSDDVAIDEPSKDNTSDVVNQDQASEPLVPGPQAPENAPVPDEEPPVVKAATSLLDNYKPEPADPYTWAFYEIDYEATSALRSGLDKIGIGKTMQRKERRKMLEKIWKPLSGLMSGTTSLYDLRLKQEILAESQKDPSERRSDVEILEPMRLEYVQTYKQIKEKLAELNEQNVDLSKYYNQMIDISTQAKFEAILSQTISDNQAEAEAELADFENNKEPLSDDSSQIPDDIGTALKDLEQDAGDGACNLAASFANVLMSGSAAMRGSLANCILDDTGDTVRYQFYGQQNALIPYKDKGADLASTRTMERAIAASQKIYEVERVNRLKEADLLPFTAPWIYCMAQACYEYGVEAGNDEGNSYAMEFYITVTAEDGNGTEDIAYNFLTNTIGKRIIGQLNFDGDSAGFNPLTEEEIQNSIPPEDKCLGKMFKLGTDKHATSLVYTRNGEKRYFNNQEVKQDTAYQVVDQPIHEFIRAKQVTNITISDIPPEIQQD